MISSVIREKVLLGCAPVVLFWIGMLACNQKPQTEAAPQKPAVLESKEGLASFYGEESQGDETASGEPFDKRLFTAAHPTYPLGTTVRVTNLDNQQSIELRINDRGPSRHNRREGVIIDISRASARRLSFTHDGRALVRVDVLEWGTPK